MVSYEYGQERVCDEEWEPTSVYDYLDHKDSLPFNREGFDKNWRGIRTSAEDWGFDLESFWNVACYIAYRTRQIFHEEFLPMDSPRQVLKDLAGRICHDGAKLTVQGGKENGTRLGVMTVEGMFLPYVSKALTYAAETMDDIPDYTIVDVSSSRGGKDTEMAAFATRRYMSLFDRLERESKAFEGVTVSKNERLFFVSKLLFYTNIVSNEKVLDSLDFIKGALRTYPSDPD